MKGQYKILSHVREHNNKLINTNKCKAFYYLCIFYKHS